MAAIKGFLQRLISKDLLRETGIVGVALLLLFAALLVIFPTYHVRYRLDFVVNDHGTIRTGSSVVEAAYQLPPDAIAIGPWVPPGSASYVYGHAVTIDLGSRGLLFVVFQGNSGVLGTMGRLPWVAYGINAPSDSTTFHAALNQLKEKGGWVDIPAEEMLMFVRFRNINDPLSAEYVDPKNLPAEYGDGVKLVSARLELTSDPITEMPADWPAWLKSFEKGNLGGADFPKPGPLGLGPINFKGE